MPKIKQKHYRHVRRSNPNPHFKFRCMLLLDRDNFKGIPDSDEEKLFKKSPASSISGSIASRSGRKLRNRSPSQSPVSSADTDKTRQRKKTNLDAIDMPMRLRERSKSMDDVNLISRPLKLRKLRKKSKELDVVAKEDETIAHRTRSESVVDQPVRRITTRQLYLELSELPEVEELSKKEQKTKSGK